MTSYKNFAKIYDEIFPFDKKYFNFLSSYVDKGEIALDIGSATGSYVKEFNKAGVTAFGLEYEKEFISYRYPLCIGDMNFLPFKKNSFDFIYSIGNTICHIESRSAFILFIQRAGKILKPKKSFLFQIINYDRIFEHNINKLPEIETENYIFYREYKYNNAVSIDFIGKVVDKKSGDTVHSFSQKLTPILYQDIIDAANRADFNFVQFFGGVGGEKFVKDKSFVTIACFTKP